MGGYDGGVGGCGKGVKYGLYITNGIIFVSCFKYASITILKLL